MRCRTPEPADVLRDGGSSLRTDRSRGLAAAVLPSALGWLLAAAALSPSIARAASWAVDTNASLGQTWTDNVARTAFDRESDTVSRVTAGIGLRSQSGLVSGHLDYSLSNQFHARDRESSQFQNALIASFNINLVESRASVAVEASIAQSAVSAFGVQPDTLGLIGANSTELRTLSVSPKFQGALGPTLQYSASLGYTTSDAANTRLGDASTSTLALHLGPAAAGMISWSLDGSHASSTFKQGRATDSERISAGLNLALEDLDLRFNANTGIELSDLGPSQRRRAQTWSLAATWAPSPRTQVSAQWDDRPFGSTHSLSLDYRTALASWHLSDSRSLSTEVSRAGTSGRGPVFDSFFSLFGALVPDPAERELFVNNFLHSQGISAARVPGFLGAAVSLQDQQALSVAWRGVRGAAALSITRSTSWRVDSGSSAVDDLAMAGKLRLIGVSLDLSHRLTPTSSINLVLSGSQGRGTSASQFNRQRQASLQYSVQPTAASSLVLGFRRGLYESAGAPFDENAVFASVNVRF